MIGSDPVETLLQTAAGYYLSRCLHAVANLGVADALAETPQSAAALAAAIGADSGGLERALKFLSSYGIFEDRDGLVAHTPASRLLRADHPRSMRPIVRMFGLHGMWASAGELEHSVRTGLPSTDKALPGGFWGYLSEHPDAARLFGEAMTAKAQGHIAAILASYDFSGFTSVADIGGGRGHLLQAVLAAAPAASGVLFDRPQVIQELSGMSPDRLKLQAGDFFTDPLPTCDAYLLMEVIHDWDDRASTKILSAVRRAAPKHAKVLLIEAMLPDNPGPNWPRTLDMVMLTIGGRQRTQAEYASLFSACGFRMTREIDTHAGITILEAES